MTCIGFIICYIPIISVRNKYLSEMEDLFWFVLCSDDECKKDLGASKDFSFPLCIFHVNGFDKLALMSNDFFVDFESSNVLFILALNLKGVVTER